MALAIAIAMCVYLASLLHNKLTTESICKTINIAI